MPFISPKDEADIAFAVEEGFDFIAASFTRSASDILELRTELKKNHNDKIRIIAKIENQDGVENIDEIINVPTASWLPEATWAWKFLWRRFRLSRRS